MEESCDGLVDFWIDGLLDKWIGLMASIIEVTNVSKSYRRDSLEIPVLSNISLAIPDGEFLH
jgi:hypothetical protein